MEITLLSRQSLADRWDFTSTKVIEKYEQQGVITRIPNLPSPRYSLEEIIRIETIGELNPLSPIERKKFEMRIVKLEKEIENYKNNISIIKNQLRL